MHVARMGDRRSAYRVLVGEPEGKRTRGKPRRRWVDNISVDIHKFHFQLVAHYLYLLFCSATCFDHKCGHLQGATSFIDVCRVYGNLYVNGRLRTYWCQLYEELTPWSRVLPEKLKRPKLLEKFPALYGTRKFITAFTRSRHLSLS